MKKKSTKPLRAPVVVEDDSYETADELLRVMDDLNQEDMIRIPVSFPKSLHAVLLTLKDEGYSVAAYLRWLAMNDLRARLEAGWLPGKGWGHHTGRPVLPYPHSPDAKKNRGRMRTKHD